MKLVDAVVAVTYRCNARCVMCNIWRAKGGEELPPSAYAKLPRSLRAINLSGGEPFLRDDLPAVVRVVSEACPRARIVISTNGLLPERMQAQMPPILECAPHIGVAVSVDGIGETHDRMRGVEGAFQKAMESVAVLRKADVGGVRLAFTITPDNVSEMAKVYDLSRREGAQFTCALAQASPHYFRTEGFAPLDTGELKRQAATVIRGELSGLSPKRWARAYFLAELVKFAEKGSRRLPCRAGSDFFFLDPEGNVYPCNVLPDRLGNIRDQSLRAVFQSAEAGRAAEKVKDCRACWMVCTARTAIRRHALGTAGWVLARKLFGGVGA